MTTTEFIVTLLQLFSLFSLGIALIELGWEQAKKDSAIRNEKLRHLVK